VWPGSRSGLPTQEYVLLVQYERFRTDLHAFETASGESGSPDHDGDWAERQDEATATLA
jgi:hypothetical protein